MVAARALLRVGWPPAAATLALAAGGALALTGRERLAALIWGTAIAATAASLLIEIAGQLRRRQPGVDLIALLAMVGAILLGEYLAGAIIAVMLTTGRALEGYAGARAERELTALLAAAPRIARRREGDSVVQVAVDEIAPGDRIVVGPGEMVPVDGILDSEHAVLDESMLTGESRPVERDRAARIASGGLNASGPLELRATATAADSTYRGLVRLVEEALRERPPLARLADRAAALFVPVTLIVAGAAWAWSGDPVRALAVLVVATPCPLILAAPIAITSGMSRLARRGMIVKGGGALEALARAEIVLLDKTGTVTAGQPRVLDVEPFDAAQPDEVVRLAASLDQVSAHVFAPALVQHARERGLQLSFPVKVDEVAGAGIEGLVDGARIRVGRADWVAEGALPPAARAVRRRTAVEGTSAVFVASDGRQLGALIVDDPLRAEAVRTVRGLRRAGIRRIVLVTGDRADVAELIGEAVDVDRVLAERTPEEKVDAVRQARADGLTVMVGDGVNDAPALAHADVGIAMGGRGATASSQAADIVVVVDRFDRVHEALMVARRTRRIAWQSIQAGMGMSFAAMGFAAVGLLAPVAGALVQEGIDVVAIALALRALGGREVARVPSGLEHVGDQLRAEHHALQSGIDRIRTVADRLDDDSIPHIHAEVQQVHRFISDELLPHELAEERELYPLLVETAGGEDPTPALRHTHREIRRLARLIGHIVQSQAAGGLAPEDLPELRRLLYGLHAILRLHMAQEEEAFGIFHAATSGAAPVHSLAPQDERPPPAGHSP